MQSSLKIFQRFFIDVKEKDAQETIFKIFLISSLSAHILFTVAQQLFSFTFSAPAILEEPSFSVDLISDIMVTSPTKDAIPDVKKDEDLSVSKDILPQLPKKFALDEIQNPEDVNPDADSAEKNLEELKSNSEKTIHLKKDDAEKNRLAKDEALRRLALERLRQDASKQDKETKAPNVDELAKLKEQLQAKLSDSMNGSGGSLGAGSEKYRGVLQKAIGRHYAIPEAYSLKNADLRVVIAISVGPKGELLSSKIHSSSGDDVFDQLAFKAVSQAAPLPFPPEEQANQTILLNFSPKSF